MGRMKGLAAILGAAVLMVVVVACGGNELDSGDGPMEIAQSGGQLESGGSSA